MPEIDIALFSICFRMRVNAHSSRVHRIQNFRAVNVDTDKLVPNTESIYQGFDWLNFLTCYMHF